MVDIYAHFGGSLAIGRRGENEARRVVFDLSAWRRHYGEGTVQLLHQRAGDENPYPCALTVEGDTAYWLIRAADVNKPGWGEAQLHYYVGDTLAKSAIWRTVTADALGDPSAAPPEPQQGWVDAVLKAGAAAEAAVSRPAYIGANGNWYTWDASAEQYTDSGVAATGPAGADGKDGAGMDITGATVGQIVKITAVDADGKPTAWEPVDMPSQVQSDWSQSDSSAKDYVKNRTHYAEIERKPVTLIGDDSTGYHAMIEDGVPFSAGDTVSVTVDGVVVSVVAQETTFSGRPAVYVGKNPLEFGEDNDSPYDWALLCAPGVETLLCIGMSTHTLEVPAYIYHTLPMKYSPLTITSDADLDNGSASGGFVQISKLTINRTITTEDRIAAKIHLSESGNTLELLGNEDAVDSLPYAMLLIGTHWYCSTTLNKTLTFTIPLEDVDVSIKDYLGTKVAGCRLLANASFLINDVEYSSLLELSVNALTGTFVTKEGYLYTVVISFNTTSTDTANGRFNQDWTIRITRIF